MVALANKLKDPVLILNKNWAPVQITSIKEAICLVAKGSARIIEPKTFEVYDLLSWADASKAKAVFGDALIRSPRLVLLPPEVVVLSNYDGMAERSVVFSRKNIFKRDRYTCQYCGAQPGPESLTIDHIKPRSKGGTSTWDNCILACLECNKKKADRSLAETGLKLRKIPKKPSWKSLVQIPPRLRRESWENFISRAYWEIGLES